jgi:hypothetical protein
MRGMRRVACVLAVVACHPEPVSPLRDPTTRATTRISAKALSADIQFLADDLLEGRGAGSKGEQIAQHYVASRMAAMGIAAGTQAGYSMPVHLRAGTVTAGSAVMTFRGKTGEVPFEAFVPMSDGRTAHVDVEAPAVFVGHGIVAPEYGYDELKDVDLHGKIAIYLVGTPESERADFFPPDRRALKNDKLQGLADRGAVGAIAVWRATDEKRLSWAKASVNAAKERVYWLDNGEPGNSPKTAPVRGVMSAAELARLAAAGGVPLTALDRRPDDPAHAAVDLGVTLHLRWDATFEDRESANVVGMVQGRDRANELVVYTTHLDHLGVNAKLTGDQIFNGAIDNASGVATLLQVAHAFASAPARRSILFVVTTGEESGLLGASAFLAHPPLPRDAIVANINIDEVPGLHPLHDVVALGLAMTDLEPQLRAAAAAGHLAVSPDPEPEQGYYGRGDNLRFALAGIPALRIEPGDLDAHGDLAAGQRAHHEWIATHYHTPKDEWSAADDFGAMADFARFAFRLGTEIANTPARPKLR